jgi:predicted alpha/beta superfamily hydrolase
MGDDFTPPPGVKRKSEKKASGRRPASGSGKRFLHFGEKAAGRRRGGRVPF